MQVQVETDNHIQNREELARYVEGVVLDAVDRFQDHLSSVQVHLHDVNSAEKSGADDFRCLLEARCAGRGPVAVEHRADNLHMAINTAADKLERALDSTFGKLEDRTKRQAQGLGHLSAPGGGV